MKMMPNNALEGARRAFFIKYPSCNDEDWENWLSANVYDSQNRVQNHEALANLCEEVLARFAGDMMQGVFEHIKASQGYYRERADRQGYYY